LGELLNPRYLLFLLLAFLTIFSLYLPQPLSQNFLRYQRGVDLQQIGWLIAARSAGVVLLNLTIGRLAPRRAFLLAQVVMAFFALLIWQGDGLRWYFLGYMCLGGLMTARAMVTTQGRTFVKAANMGLAYGSMETAMAFAAILAPLLAGVLYSLNPTWIYTASLALIGLMLIVNLAYSPLQGRTAAVDDG
jgi:MFS family permease